VNLGDIPTLAGAILYFAIVDGLKTGDTQLIGMLADIQASDGTKIGDSPLAEALANLLNTDGFKTGDSVSQLANMLPTTTDGLKVGDTQLAEMLADLLRTDGVTLDDTTLAGLVGVIGRLLRMWLFKRPYLNMVVEKKTYRDISVETREVKP